MYDTRHIYLEKSGVYHRGDSKSARPYWSEQITLRY